ncbi:MAG: HAD-IB family phosphatase, partial [Candidatus Omnitrophica bacterium]|nr:HAD-IB family phosphatase [Candidatus Omnitrophota bacterium]
LMQLNYKAVIFDIDGTITTPVSSWRYIHEKLGKWDVLACRYQELFRAGRISYRKFCELDAAHWKGLPEKSMKELFRDVPYAKNAVTSIKKLKKMGLKLIAVSTGLQYLPGRLKKELRFDYILSNELETRRGILTGGVKINLTHGAKGKALKKIIKEMAVEPHQVISIGDSEGDIPLSRAAGYSIAFNSSSQHLSEMVDYNCQTDDFSEVYHKILEVLA